LAVIGIYAVIAFAVVQRTQEIGLRMALGAERSTILGFVLRRGIRLGLMGLGFGTIAAIALNRVLVGLLPEITPLEPAVVAVAAIVLFASIVLACYVPAWRAARLDPLVALRSE
jgi:putative ABC transport system permease protein